ncbi:hypothetical protein CWG93_18935 [Salmonella enterica subsp. enterica serovar Sandiego]|nr:hypothetical protein [Salmonella enterica subsp. enterica serovar Sandiego]
MKKLSTFLVPVVLATGVFSTTTYAAYTSSPMTLQWQGQVPVTPVPGGAWSFVSAVNPSTAFVPSTGSIIVTNGTKVGEKNITITPVNFSIKSSTGLTANSAIKAYLASPVAFSGLNAKPGITDKPELNFMINTHAISVGSGASADVGNAPGTAAANNMVDINITGTGTLKSDTFTEGDTFTASATIMFSADAV